MTKEEKIKRDHAMWKYVHECFNYDPDTGTLTWCKRPLHHFKNKHGQNIFNTKYAEKQAGCIYGKVNKTEYLVVRINFNGLRKLVFGHRMIFLWWHGWLPEQLDHINGDGTDNRIKNLRAANSKINNRNSKLSKLNKSGVSGVRKMKSGNWEVQIGSQGGRKHLGTFPTFDEAVQVRKAAEKKYGYHPNHGLKAEIY